MKTNFFTPSQEIIELISNSTPERKDFFDLVEGRETGEILSQDQGMDALGPFQSAHCLQITQMTDDMVVSQNAPGTQNVPGHSGHPHGLSHVVEFGQGDLGWPGLMLIQ